MLYNSSAQPFPTIRAETLSKKPVVFPDVAKGKYAFILIAFKRQTQGEVDGWLDPFIEEFGGKTNVAFYEIPMISNSWKWMSSWIDSGMRAGVPEYKHSHVATYYGPLDKYFDSLEIEDKNTVHVFLLDRQGQIIWKETGPVTNKKYEDLRMMMEEANKTGTR